MGRFKLPSILPFLLILISGLIIWSYWIISTHSAHAVVSWDEGFHGGTALFISQSLRDNFRFSEYKYILDDFLNGLIWYLPLWWGLAGLLGAVAGPSVEVYRLATTLFAVSSIIVAALFVKREAGQLAGLLAGLFLAMTPVFIVYSHLMMIEVPLLFSTSLALVFLYRYLTLKQPSRIDLSLTLAAFILGTATKITAIAVILAVTLAFGIFLHLFFSKSLMKKRFFSAPIAIFLVTAFVTFGLYRYFTRTYFNADMLVFYLDQMRGMTGGDFLSGLLNTASRSLAFYLQDLAHMPVLAFFWVGSFLGYLFLKRTPLAHFLFIWTIVTFFIFSAVKPQALQYILPLFFPIACGAGLFWGEWLKFSCRLMKIILVSALAVFIVWMGSDSLRKSETFGWRSTITNQDRAAAFVAEQANIGERVISTGDGTRFSIRLYGLSKKLQTINGAAQICSDSVQDSTDWAISDFGPQSPIRIKELGTNNWVKVASFPGTNSLTDVFKNHLSTTHVNISGDKFMAKICPRTMLLGKNVVTVEATPSLLLPNSQTMQPNLMFSLNYRLMRSVKNLSVSPKELLISSGKLQRYSLEFDQQKINQPLYLLVYIPKNLDLKINQVSFQREN